MGGLGAESVGKGQETWARPAAVAMQWKVLLPFHVAGVP